MKICRNCKVEKPLTDFYFKKQTGRKPYTSADCKRCASDKSNQYRKDNPHIRRNNNKRRNPGWDITRYEEFVVLQNNLCAICGTSDPILSDWCCDHDHKTNQARGLLCLQCNAGLGYFRDNPEVLKSAIEYLNKWKESGQE